MKRPLLLFSISLISGVLAAKTASIYVFLFISMVMAVITVLIFLRKFRSGLLIFSGILLFYFAGAFEFMYVEHVNTARFVEFSGEQVLVKGFICSEPDVRELKTIYNLKVSEISASNGTRRINGKVQLTTLRNNESGIYEYGSEIEVRGKLNIPKGRRIPGGFDYRSFLAKSGISATIYANREDIVAGSGRGGNALVKIGLGLRSRIINVIEKSLPKEQAALLNGMLIGYTAGMDEKISGAFSDAGLSHITAVSGMNVAFIAFPLIFLFKKMRIGQRTANFIVIGVLVVFIFVTGFSPSVARAVIMAVIMLVAQIIRRETDVITSISFAAILLILYNPYSLFDIGFQLSFAATLSLVLFYKSLKKFFSFKFLPGFVSDVLAATLAAQIGTLPITAFYFNKVSIISLVSNLVVVPLVEAVTIIGALMAIAGQFSIIISQILGYINCTFLTFILYIVKISSSIPYAVIRVFTPTLFIICLYYATVMYFLWLKPLYKIRLKARYYTAVAGVLLLILAINFIIPKDLEVVFMDVGEGDSAFIRTASGKTVLIDGGGFAGRTDTEHTMGDYTVIPYLLDNAILELDLVIATHGHDDHIQGVKSVLRDYKVDNLIIPYTKDTKDFKKILDLASIKGIPSRMCREGETIRLDSQTYFRVLYPIEGYEIVNSPVNNNSLLLKLCYRNTSILFTGDLEQDIEKVLLEKGTDLKADVLKVAHHGSVTSTTEDYLKAINPRAAVISVGTNNFGHPSEYVLDRLRRNNVRSFRTDKDGTIILTSDGSKMKFKKTIEE